MRKIHIAFIAAAFLPLFAFAQASPPPLPPQAGHSGQYLTTNGAKASWAAVSGGTGVPAGSNNQLQYNNAGAFGGFTLGGDATIVPATGILTVTKTGGVSFATSATTDTTNASNIASGSLGAARFPVFTGLMLDTAGTASAYAGTSCTNQFARSLSASGVATCATVANTDLANSSVTVAGHSVALGGSTAVACGDLSNAGSACQATAPAGSIVGTTDTQTLTNKTIDTASGNTVSVNGSSLTAVTGTGNTLVLTISPTLTTPNIGAATGSSLALSGNISAANLPVLNGTNTATGLVYADGTNLNYGGALTTGQLIQGGASGPVSVGSFGTTTTVWHGNAAGGGSYTSIGTNDLASAAVTPTKAGGALVTVTRTIYVGDTSGSTLTNAQLGPQKYVLPFNASATLLEIGVTADTGTPNVIVGLNHAGSVSNVVSSALATGAAGAYACSKTGATASTFNGTTTCAATLQNTTIAQGDFIELVSGTAGGTAHAFQIHATWLWN